MVHAIQSVIGTLAGMVCDGAKESCAFKLSSSVSLAIQFSYLALDGACIQQAWASSAIPLKRPSRISAGSIIPAWWQPIDSCWA